MILPRPSLAAFAVVLATLAPLAACKRAGQTACEPDDHRYEQVAVLIQAGEALNLDDDGNALPTVIRVAQLSGDLATRSLDFDALWADPEAALGDELLDLDELQVYPGSADELELIPDPKARFVLAFAGFQRPGGGDWYRVYRLPARWGEQVCAGIDDGQDPATFGSPCMYLLLERSRVEGGELPPPGFDLARAGGRCAAPTKPEANPEPGPEPEAAG